MTAFEHGCFSLAGESERTGSGASAMAGYSIFIAHAPADAQVAEAVTQLLAETGATVLYGADTSPTPEALEDLEQTALAADAYVVLLSRASITSPRIRAVTRKYHEQRQTHPLRTLLPIVLEPFSPSQLWPFLRAYPRIEALPRTVNAAGEPVAVAPPILALGIMQALRLAVPPRMRRLTGIPVGQPARQWQPSATTPPAVAGGLVPQLQAPLAGPWRLSRGPSRLGGAVTALLALLVATAAFLAGATPFHLVGSVVPTATAKTLILAPGTDTPVPPATATALPR